MPAKGQKVVKRRPGDVVARCHAGCKVTRRTGGRAAHRSAFAGVHRALLQAAGSPPPRGRRPDFLLQPIALPRSAHTLQSGGKPPLRKVTWDRRPRVLEKQKSHL